METVELDLKYSRIQKEMWFPEKHFPKFTVAPKGRRSGLSTSAANAFIEYSLSEDFWFLPEGPILMLWVSTINATLEKHFDRLFMPNLRKLHPSQWQWKSQEKILKIGRATIDFRTAEKPESIEGQSYHIIFLDECGITLQNDYLFNNAILPMLMDYTSCKIILGGTPKGKRTKNGVHKFFELYQKAQHDKEGYRIITFTGRDNPFIDRSELDNIAAQMDELTMRQEILGEFVEMTENRFLYAFTEDHIIKSYEPNPHLPLLFSYDFNKQPMTCVVGQSLSANRSIIFDEVEMNDGSTPEVCEILKKKYSKWVNSGAVDITGDATGRNRSALTRGNLNHYRIIKDELMLKDRNIRVPKQNPAIKDSRILCNSVLQNAQFSITENCTRTINDLFTANVDADSELIKNAKIPLHLFDGWRYFIHCLYPDFITNPNNYKTT